MKLLTTQEAADKLGVSVRRVVAMINAGQLPSQRFGRSHVIKEEDLKLVEKRQVGRPLLNIRETRREYLRKKKQESRSRKKV